jgi:hypothetical protein
MDSPTTRTISITCPTKGCGESQMMAVPIARPLSDLGVLTCPQGHRFRFTPTAEAAAIDEETTEELQ